MPGHTKRTILSHGRWQIDPLRRELRSDGVRVPLGARSFDIIDALVQSPGMLVTKDDLMRLVWANVTVEENAIQVHISAIRKAFGADRNLIRTLSGRGYCLMGDWTAAPIDERQPGGPHRPLPQTASRPLRANLKGSTYDLIGRGPTLTQLNSLVSAYRMVTLVGPGGVGKTQLALEVARAQMQHFADRVWLIELAPFADPDLVPTIVSSAIGLDLGPSTVSTELAAAAIGEQRLLLVLDSCEHVIDAVANFVGAVMRSCSFAHVLATSREPLRVSGEQTYRVLPLDVPTEVRLTTSAALQHSAVQLMIARLRAAGLDFEPEGDILADIISICRRIDGLPLAIELAAARAASVGIANVARQIGDHLPILVDGRRTAPPRHRTLRATLDWSYQLLSEGQRLILRRLAVFAGGFTMEAACDVLLAPELGTEVIMDSIASLISQSLLALDRGETESRYVMLETIRAYASELLGSDPDGRSLARRHAVYFQQLSESTRATWDDRDTYVEARRRYMIELGNVRAALEWAFSPSGDALIAVALTDSATPLLFDMSLVGECHQWAARALQLIGSGTALEERREARLRMMVQAARVYTDGPSADSLAGWEVVLDMAMRLGDFEAQARALWGLWNDNTYGGEHRAGLAYAEQFAAWSATRSDVAKQIISRRLIGISRHYQGHQAVARRHLDYVLAHYDSAVRRWATIGSRLNQVPVTRATLARVLWLQGQVDEARHVAELAAREAAAEDHVQSMVYILVEAAVPLSMLSGEFETAAQLLDTLLELAARSGVTIWEVHGHCIEAALHVMRGDAKAGLSRLQNAIGALRASGFCAHLTMFLAVLAEAQARTNDYGVALATIDSALDRCDTHGERWIEPELMRIKAGIMAASTSRDLIARAEPLLHQALDLARRQDALSWELRLATSLARLLRDAGDPAAATAALAPVYARFREGFTTKDLVVARSVLDQV